MNGALTTTDRNYRLRAVLYSDGIEDTLIVATSEYTWYKDEVELTSESGLGLNILNVNAEDITNGEESAYRVSIDTAP